MALYPHNSRRKRLETAGTVALLYLTVVGLFAGAIYIQGPRWSTEWGWMTEIGAFGVIGFMGLIAYVRGGRR